MSYARNTSLTHLPRVREGCWIGVGHGDVKGFAGSIGSNEEIPKLGPYDPTDSVILEESLVGENTI